MGATHDWILERFYLVDMEDYRTQFLTGLAKAHKIALDDIRSSQVKQQEFQYRVGERVMVYMPGEIRIWEGLETREALSGTVPDLEPYSHKCRG